VTALAISDFFTASGDESGTVYLRRLWSDDGDEFETKIEVEGNMPVTNLLFHPQKMAVFVSTSGPDVGL